MLPSGAATAHCSRANEKINAAAQEANSPNNENGPNQLKKCWRIAPRRKLSAAPRQIRHALR